VKTVLLIFFVTFASCNPAHEVVTNETFCGHHVVLDNHGKIIPWHLPRANAFDHFLRLRWEFVKNAPASPGPPPRSSYPQYYFYCAFKMNNGVLEPDAWMNDIGEKIPNWFESARLYYAYSGDSTVMEIMKGFVNYTILHGTTPADFAWPGFPHTTTNAGDTIFLGFTSSKKLALNEIQVDHAGEMGLTFYRMYLYTGDKKYLTSALNVADVLSRYTIAGDGEHSALPYRVVTDSGRVTAPYGANWSGSYILLESLIRANLGYREAYLDARDKIRDFILNWPVKTGYWTDGHSDTDVKSNTYKSNLSNSNMVLSLFDYPELDPEWRSDIPKLIKWTEDNFIFRSAPGEPSTMWGANIVGEQDSFNFKMDYQTARYGAECARWFAVSGDTAYKEKAWRSLSWVTYCNDSTGMAYESPVSKGILSWWSDCYGECPRMFYQAFAAVPEWAPPHENHILYSECILNHVQYDGKLIRYTATTDNGIEYLRLSFRPRRVTVNEEEIEVSKVLNPDTYLLKSLGHGDFAFTIKHKLAGNVIISG
jgi:hypothetical protein